MCLAAELRPDPVGELKRSPYPLAAIGGRGPTSKGKERKGKGREKEGAAEGGKRKGREMPPLYLTSSYGPDC